MGRPLRPTLDVLLSLTRARHAPPGPPPILSPPSPPVHIPAPTPLSPSARPRDDPAGGWAVERGAGVRFGNEDSAAKRATRERRIDVARSVWCVRGIREVQKPSFVVLSNNCVDLLLRFHGVPLRHVRLIVYIPLITRRGRI